MADEIDRAALTQKWIHSHEEDTDGETVFRPSSYGFPRSRGRRSFQLALDGSMVEEGIGSDDRPTHISGSWKLNDANELELVRPNGSKTVMPLIRVDSNRLVAKKS